MSNKDTTLLDSVKESLLESTDTDTESVDEGAMDLVKGAGKVIKKVYNHPTVKPHADELVRRAATRAVKGVANKGHRLLDKTKTKKESVMSEYDDTHLNEAGSETPTLDTKSEEDPKLYQDAEGKHAKIDTDKGTEGKDKKNKASIAGKSKGPSSFETPTASGSSQERMEQHMTALFDGEELTEGFQTKAVTIFEAAINERVSEVEASLLEQYETILSENIEEISNNLSEKLDDYLGYVVENWVEENKLALENGIRMEVAENFISGLKVLFENNFIDVPDEKYDLLDEVTATKDELEEQLNKALQESIELRKEILSHRCGEIFVEQADGLTDVEVEKLASLTEGIEFENEQQYRDKISVLRESYFNNTPVLTEETETTNQVISEGGPMDRYTNVIGRHASYNKVS